MTYNQANNIIDSVCRTIWVKDEKTGKTRTATPEEALRIMKQQADAFPQTKKLYDRYKQAYDASAELVKKHLELKENEQDDVNSALKFLKLSLSD